MHWSGLVDRLSSALAGLNVDVPEIALVQSTGLAEFGAADACEDVIVLPRGRIAISGDDRRDFFLLAHEPFHLLSWNDPASRDTLYELLVDFSIGSKC